MSPSAYVWVVSSSNYGEQQGVEAVFSSPEAADSWAQIKNQGPTGDHYYVQCWKLDAALTNQGSHPGLAR